MEKELGPAAEGDPGSGRRRHWAGWGYMRP